MAIASGPRVGLYGGRQTSSLSRSLARTTKRSGKKQLEKFSLFGEDESQVKPDRTVSTGGQPAHYASYHHDGRLLAIGCDFGYVKICDSQSRVTIRTFATHGTKGGYTIRSTGWLPEVRNKQRMIWSAGDDAILRIWDLSGDIVGVGDSAKPLISMKGHGDSIRSCNIFSYGTKINQKSCLVTGSYDHTIRLWNVDNLAQNSALDDDENENDRCMSIMNHGSPVEAILILQPSKEEAPFVVSAGGTTIKLWNPLLGECLSTTQTKHNKTITSLCLANIIRNEDDDTEGETNGVKNISKRLMSAGLDGLIRIYSVDNIFADKKDGKKEKDVMKKYSLQYLHGIKTSEPITALAMSPDNTRLVVGSSTGFATVRQRAKYVRQGVKRKNRDAPRVGTYTYFMRGANVGADADDHLVIQQKKKKLQKYDAFLQKFRYSDALDAALASRDPRAVSTLNFCILYRTFLCINTNKSSRVLLGYRSRLFWRSWDVEEA
jgi:U3 small nucleolar RNA-associated protein 15